MIRIIMNNEVIGTADRAVSVANHEAIQIGKGDFIFYNYIPCMSLTVYVEDAIRLLIRDSRRKHITDLYNKSYAQGYNHALDDIEKNLMPAFEFHNKKRDKTKSLATPIPLEVTQDIVRGSLTKKDLLLEVEEYLKKKVKEDGISVTNLISHLNKKYIVEEN